MASLSLENGGSEWSAGAGAKGFMLFGVKVMEGGSSSPSSFIRKSASTNNLAQFEQAAQDSSYDVVAAGYASDDVVHASDRSRHRKRGVAWSEEEHKLFLLGLQKVGKGDWRGISRSFVKTRTPTQVASHAQKYFLRRNSLNRRRRRSSLFDITTEAVLTSANEDQIHQDNLQEDLIMNNNLEKLLVPTFPVAVDKPVVVPIVIDQNIIPMENLKIMQVNKLNNSPRPLSPIPILPASPPSAKTGKLDLDRSGGGATVVDRHQFLSLKLSSSPITTPSSLAPPQPQPQEGSTGQQPLQAERHAAAFPAMPASFDGSGGDSIISVS